jgi:serine/threonine protein kinase
VSHDEHSTVSTPNSCSRDLHPNNVLVARAVYVNDSEDHAIVTDIGEGKILDIRDIDTSAGASYGCSEFRAPEVHGGQGWSSAADVFSFGVLCCKVLELRGQVCARVPIPTILQQAIPLSDGEEIAPKDFAEAVKSCLSSDPGLRPSIRSVITHLDDLTGDFFYEEDGYSSRRALKEQPEELLDQIEWSPLNWRQALATARGFLPTGASRVFNTRDSILDD